jgi:hypothetical protein
MPHCVLRVLHGMSELCTCTDGCREPLQALGDCLCKGMSAPWQHLGRSNRRDSAHSSRGSVTQPAMANTPGEMAAQPGWSTEFSVMASVVAGCRHIAEMHPAKRVDDARQSVAVALK